MRTLMEKIETQHNEIVLPQLQMAIGVWINGETYWLSNHQNEKIFTNENLTIKIKQEYLYSNVRKSQIYMTNHQDKVLELKLIIKHFYNRASRDHLTFISPREQVIFHLADKKVILVNGEFEGKPIQQATVQPYWYVNNDQIWTCPLKGILKYQPMAKGLAVSLCTLNISIPGNETKKSSIWAVQGESKNELLNINQSLFKNPLAFPFKK